MLSSFLPFSPAVFLRTASVAGLSAHPEAWHGGNEAFPCLADRRQPGQGEWQSWTRGLDEQSFKSGKLFLHPPALYSGLSREVKR